MYCPFCSAFDTRVIDSRLVADGGQVRRRRECLECNERFTTYELAELVMPRGIKSDGTCKAVLQTVIDHFKTLEIRRIGGEDILFAFGRTWLPRPSSKRQQLGYMLVKNLGANGSDYKAAQIHCELHRGFGEPLEDGPDNSGNLFNTTKKDMSLDMTVSKNGDYFHFSRKGNLWTFKGENKGNNLWCPVPIAHW